MSCVQPLREFISRRLAAAATEICAELEKTLIRYEDQIHGQRRLLELTWKPQMTLNAADPPQQQDRSPSRDPEIQESSVEECPSPSSLGGEGGQLVLEEENKTIMVTEPGRDQLLCPSPAVWTKSGTKSCGLKGNELEIITTREHNQQYSHTSPMSESGALQQQDRKDKLVVDQQIFRLQEAEPLHMKEEQEELCTSQDQGQLALNETHISIVTINFDERDLSDHGLSCQNLLIPDTTVSKSKYQEGIDWSGPGPKNKKGNDFDRGQRNVIDNFPMSQSHCNIKTDTNSIKCDVCGKAFKNKYLLKNHQRTHTGEQHYSCKSCDKSFTQLSNLTYHMRIHTGEKPFSCNTCGRSFSQSGSLTAHMRTHTRPYPGNMCGKSFQTNADLLSHIRNHTAERPYSCKTCGKSFNKSFNLTVHMRIHTGERPYSCTMCSKTFKRSDDLLRHSRTHTKKRPYSCTMCGKGFTQSCHLIVHRRTHTGERPYSCETCGKCFIQSFNLTVHMRTHTGEKPFSCNTCGKRFFENQSLKIHMRTHMG
ncbi:uncharacterized protein ACNS7B_004075 [Menidia menidia]